MLTASPVRRRLRRCAPPGLDAKLSLARRRARRRRCVGGRVRFDVRGRRWRTAARRPVTLDGPDPARRRTTAPGRSSATTSRATTGPGRRGGVVVTISASDAAWGSRMRPAGAPAGARPRSSYRTSAVHPTTISLTRSRGAKEVDFSDGVVWILGVGLRRPSRAGRRRGRHRRDPAGRPRPALRARPPASGCRATPGGPPRGRARPDQRGARRGRPDLMAAGGRRPGRASGPTTSCWPGSTGSATWSSRSAG